jgi:hypothetical protein
LRHTQGDVPATRVPQQVEGADPKALYESNYVGHMLGDREAMAHAVPAFWKEVPQADRYDPVLVGQWSQRDLYLSGD